MFGVSIDGSTNVLCNNKAIYNNTTTPDSVLKKKDHFNDYQRFRYAVADNTIRVTNQVNENNMYDLFTNIMTASRRRSLLEKFTY